MNLTKRDLGHLPFSIMVVMTWGIVPAFAKISGLAGGLTTMYVNWFAVLALFLLLVCRRSLTKLTGNISYKKLVILGLIWPFAYSIAYFTSIDLGSSSLTTIMNYTWPFFYLILAATFSKTKTRKFLGFDIQEVRFSKRYLPVVLLAISAVMVPIVMEEKIYFFFLPMILGLFAALAQSFYVIATEKLDGDEVVITFVISAVTAIGATIYVLLFEKVALPNIRSLGYTAIIGVFSNGIGFLCFLKASKMKGEANELSKLLFLIILCLVPIVQMVLLPIFRVERVPISRWIAIVLVFFVYYLLRKQEKRELITS